MSLRYVLAAALIWLVLWGAYEDIDMDARGCKFVNQEWKCP